MVATTKTRPLEPRGGGRVPHTLALVLTVFQLGVSGWGADFGFSNLPTALLLTANSWLGGTYLLHSWHRTYMSMNHFVCFQDSALFNGWATSLEPVCCKKRQKIVPDQLLVCGVGDL